MNLDAANVVGIKSFHDQCCIYHRLTLGSLTAFFKGSMQTWWKFRNIQSSES